MIRTVNDLQAGCRKKKTTIIIYSGRYHFTTWLNFMLCILLFSLTELYAESLKTLLKMANKIMEFLPSRVPSVLDKTFKGKKDDKDDDRPPPTMPIMALSKEKAVSLA